MRLPAFAAIPRGAANCQLIDLGLADLGLNVARFVETVPSSKRPLSAM